MEAGEGYHSNASSDALAEDDVQALGDRVVEIQPRRKLLHGSFRARWDLCKFPPDSSWKADATAMQHFLEQRYNLLNPTWDGEGCKTEGLFVTLRVSSVDVLRSPVDCQKYPMFCDKKLNCEDGVLALAAISSCFPGLGA